MESKILTLKDILAKGDTTPPDEWQIRAILSEECLSYVVWNTRTKEGLVIDPKLEDWNSYIKVIAEQPGIRWLAVVDTHTHADHISVAAKLAAHLHSPLLMHELSPSRRVDLRVSRTTKIQAQAAPIQLVATPGHTPDSMSVIWGPYLFGGDTILFGDTGRDDLPGGDPTAHYDSVQELKRHASAEMIFLPGHDHKGGRASTWKTQLQVNSSLTQGREDFIREAAAFDGASPQLLKKALAENFK